MAHRLADAEAMMVRLGVSAEERLVRHGNAVLEIKRLATRLEPAMLVVGTRGRRSVKAALLGSVSRDLLRSAPCPVMVVPRTDAEPLRGAAVVCGVDDDGRGEEAVSVAGRLAAAIGDRLVLAHVTQRKDAAAARQAAAALPVEELSASAALEPARLLRDARRHVRDGVDVTVALRQGVAAEELAVLARDVDAAAIVVASRGAGSLSTMVGGSVAQELTTRSHCPVVVVPLTRDALVPPPSSPRSPFRAGCSQRSSWCNRSESAPTRSPRASFNASGTAPCGGRSAPAVAHEQPIGERADNG